tara:strand:- start:1444 stop:2367 length:924 start_codon:yes stop_codon:yes gene_type:complete
MITNKHGLPEAFVNFARNDKYTKGDSDISVTQLIDSPRVLLMREKHRDEISTDAMDMVFALFGTAVHAVLEGATGDNVVKEERIYADVKGWTLSGAIDQYEIEDDGIIITDYKVTSVWSVIYSKQEWVNQLNVYAYLLEKEKNIPVKKIQICAILRDWNRREASLKPDYPDTPMVVLDIPLRSFKARTQYVESRMDIHQEARQSFDFDDTMTLCNSDERWARPDKWAVMKKGRKSAIKLFNDKEIAEDHIEWKKSQPSKGSKANPYLSDDYYVEHRKGDNPRCSGNYCGVAEFCSQYREMLNEQERL